MKKHYRFPLIIFLGISFLLALIFFTLPINLFDGIIVKENGLSSYELESPLSLSYFIGLGYDEADMVGVTDFYLTMKGKLIAVIFIFGFPGLLAYRIYLKRKAIES